MLPEAPNIILYYNWGEPERAPHKQYMHARIIFIYLYYGTYVRTSPARVVLYIVYAVRDIFQHQLRGCMKELLCVTCKGAASTRIYRRLHEAMLEEEGAIDQSVSISESPEHKRDRRRLEPFVHQADS